MPLNIPVLLGTMREGRQSLHPAEWLVQYITASHPEIATKLVDVGELGLPPYTLSDGHKIAGGAYTNPKVQAWADTVAAADALIIVSPEYNHGYPGALKDALDYLYYEYAYKPIGICGVSGGGLGGARMVEQLRQVMIEFHAVPIREALYFSSVRNLFDAKGAPTDPKLHERADMFLKELTFLAEVLKRGRAEVGPKP